MLTGSLGAGGALWGPRRALDSRAERTGWKLLRRLEPAETPLQQTPRTGQALLLSVSWWLGEQEKHSTLTT